MQYVLIIHEVEDYESWKKVFDNAADLEDWLKRLEEFLAKYNPA